NALAEVSYQLSKAYALDRKQGRNADGETALIIEHADVRRMLLTQRAYTEAGRALSVFMGLQIDQQYHHQDESVRHQCDGMMSLLTPVAKAFFTDKGYESCNLGLQVLGGHGYIREWGLEQLVRDAKIAQIYEGTNGIQAQDFLVRKVCLDKQGLIEQLFTRINESLNKECQLTEFNELKKIVAELQHELQELTEWLRDSFPQRNMELQGGATDYLHAVGHLVFGWMWLEMLVAAEKSTNSSLRAKKKIAALFFCQHLLPSAFAQCRRVKQGYQAFASIDSDLI
ncbi:MAG: acyl-CoA dehydrogenase, partial [Kangiellaceae bacterium]|nr:acyl-CoA dehydrogenase [Kangiellaceae bacterium]